MEANQEKKETEQPKEEVASEEEMKDEKVTAQPEQRSQGMTQDQLQAELDVYESQLFAEEQKKVLNEFDLEHRIEAIKRNLRQNDRVIARISSNALVTKKEMSKLKD